MQALKQSIEKAKPKQKGRTSAAQAKNRSVDLKFAFTQRLQPNTVQFSIW